MDQYDCLNKAQLSFEYLHTNSTTHTFLFGAIAELLDNSRDAGARNLDIYTNKDPSLRGGFYLAFLDDGCGMHYDDVYNIIVFGKSAKRHAPDSNQIGQYGNGLKSGAMRVANDFILFTKKDNMGTCLFLSRSFHQEEHISQVICPMPCFDLRTEQPIGNTDLQQIPGTRTYTFDQQKHDLEMRLIMKYSPFKTMKDLFEQFSRINSSSGTLIVLYNVKLSDTGDPELDIRTDPYDILIDSRNRRILFDDEEDSTPLEYRSLRAYVSILYFDPRMRITIQRRRVITRRLPYTLYKPRQYQFKSSRFKTRSEQEIKKYEKDLISLEERQREADSQVMHAQQTMGVTTSFEDRTRVRKLQIRAAELKDMTTRLRNTLTRKKSELNTTKTLTFIFGLNIQNRAADGVFVYNCGRLIKMYEKIGQPNKKTVYCRGVVGVVDVPSIVLEPTHNKQSFADEKEYHFLLKNMGEYMRQYWSDTGIENHVKEFWELYGYRDDQLDRGPSNDPEATKRRQFAVPMLIQCDKCLKWRRLPYSGNATLLTQTQLESWQCSDNSDVSCNKCSVNEKLESIPEGELRPKTATTPAATVPMTNPPRTVPKTASPPPAPLASTARSLATNKRVSTGEISSTTISSKAREMPTRSVASTSSKTPQKRTIPPSRSSSEKLSSAKRRKRPVSQQSTKTKGKRTSAASDEDDDDAEGEDDEEEEDEEEEENENQEESEEEEEDERENRTRRKTRSQIPTKPSQKAPLSPPTRSSRSTLSSRSNQTSRTELGSTPSESVSSTNQAQQIDGDTDVNDTNTRLPPPTIGARVIAMYQGARRPGQVISVNDKRGLFKMRFDEFPTAEFDYSFSYKSSAWSYISAPPPISSTPADTHNSDSEPLGTIARKFKALIKFMLPPDWELSREQIATMSNDDLSKFDVDTFMQSYREKMTKIVEQRKAEEARWRTTAQRIQSKVTDLLNVSGMPIAADSSIEDFESQVQNYISNAKNR